MNLRKKENIMTRKTGSHLTYEERCHIYAYKHSEKSNREIALLIGCSHTTINEEIKRNTGKRGYRNNQADKLSQNRRTQASSTPKKMTLRALILIQYILMDNQASPEQISGSLSLNHGLDISHETIYKHIWKDKKNGGELYTHLRHKAKKYNKRSGKNAGRGLIPNRRDISERPDIVEEKTRLGDLELDTIVGAQHQGAIVSSVDRASKYTFLGLVRRATAENVGNSLCKSLQPLGDKGLIRTMTSDNGKEFAGHESIVERLGGDFYFATPYHSWERGLNEHTNGLVRQYFPKGSDFTILSQEDVDEVARKLNSRPRKILNYQTPAEVFLRMTNSELGGNFHS
jgi:IS30 family transposase